MMYIHIYISLSLYHDANYKYVKCEEMTQLAAGSDQGSKNVH